MNDDERTIIDPQYTENNSQDSNSNAQPTESAQQPKSNKMGWGEKAAYAAGGAAFGAGMTMAGQAMASPSAEVPVDAPETPVSDDKKDEEATAESATAAEPAIVTESESTTPEFKTETKVTIDEVSGVTVESAGTIVHVTGNADVSVNNGSIHVTSGTASHSANQGSPVQGQAPDPGDAIVATATGVRVAQVDNSSSFSQAFADARAQVGPGGVFEWHGRVYATYYKEEWDSMSASERHSFQSNIDYKDVLNEDSKAQPHNGMSNHNPHRPGETHRTDETSGPGETNRTDETSGPGETNRTDETSGPSETNRTPPHRISGHVQQPFDETDVHVIEVAQIDLDDDGIPEDAALLEVNGHEIIIVDIDHDGIADEAIVDVDGDGVPERGDISNEGIVMPEMSDGDTYYTNNSGPDYMNEANIDNFMA